MAKETDLMGGVEKLLKGLLREAALGDTVDTDGKVTKAGPSFQDRMKLAAVCTQFQVARTQKLATNEPPPASGFQQEILDAISGAAGGASGGGKGAAATIGSGAGRRRHSKVSRDDGGPEPKPFGAGSGDFDPLAPAGAKYPNGHRIG